MPDELDVNSVIKDNADFFGIKPYDASAPVSIPNYLHTTIIPLLSAPSTVVLGHTTPATALLAFSHPFGRHLRCLKRHWIETSMRGQQKHQQRHCYQTTVKAFNVEYTQFLLDNGIHNSNEAMIAENKLKIEDWLNEHDPMTKPRLWNKPKLGTYHALMFLYTGKLATRTEAGTLTGETIDNAIITFGLYSGGQPPRTMLARALLGDWLLPPPQPFSDDAGTQDLNVLKIKLKQIETIERSSGYYKDWYSEWDKQVEQLTNPDWKEILLGARGF